MALTLKILITLDDDAMTNSDEVIEALNDALGGSELGPGDGGRVLDMAGRTVGGWAVKDIAE